jgi:hypothetical protein
MQGSPPAGQLRAAKPVPVPSLLIQFSCHPERSEEPALSPVEGILREARHSLVLIGRGRRIVFDASGEGPNSKFRAAPPLRVIRPKRKPALSLAEGNPESFLRVILTEASERSLRATTSDSFAQRSRYRFQVSSSSSCVILERSEESRILFFVSS